MARDTTPQMGGLLHARLVTVLTVLVLVFSGLALFLGLTREAPAAPAALPGGGGTYEAAALPDHEGEALAAVVSTLPRVLSYDHRQLPADLAAVTALMTPEYAPRFRAVFNRSVRPVARREQRVAQGSVVAAGVVRAESAERVRVLAFVDQRISRGATPSQARVSRSRVVVLMVLRDDEWKVGALDLL